jgi:hypothetical protein
MRPIITIYGHISLDSTPSYQVAHIAYETLDVLRDVKSCCDALAGHVQDVALLRPIRQETRDQILYLPDKDIGLCA